jgi:hypothetical protein
MFYGCSGLTVIPEMKIKKLANSCYLNMFNFCNGLTSISALELPATTLA